MRPRYTATPTTDRGVGDVRQLERRLTTRLGRAIGDLFNGQIKAMHARLRVKNGRHTVIRPLLDVWEDQIVEYVRARGLPVVCCACPGCQDPTLKHHRVKRLLRELERVHPGIKRSLLRALGRVDLGSLLIPSRRERAEASLVPLVASALAAEPAAGV